MLEGISTKGKRAARNVLYARALLLLDAGEYGRIKNCTDCFRKQPSWL